MKFRVSDEEWKEQTIKNTSQAQFNTEFECEFLGSIDTLIAPHTNLNS